MAVKTLEIAGADVVHKLSRPTNNTMDLEMHLTSGFCWLVTYLDIQSIKWVRNFNSQRLISDKYGKGQLNWSTSTVVWSEDRIMPEETIFIGGRASQFGGARDFSTVGGT